MTHPECFLRLPFGQYRLATLSHETGIDVGPDAMFCFVLQAPWSTGTECVAKYNFQTANEQDLPFCKGDVLTIIGVTRVTGPLLSFDYNVCCSHLKKMFVFRIRTGTKPGTSWAEREPFQQTMSRRGKESNQEGNSVLCRKCSMLAQKIAVQASLQVPTCASKVNESTFPPR